MCERINGVWTFGQLETPALARKLTGQTSKRRYTHSTLQDDKAEIGNRTEKPASEPLTEVLGIVIFSADERSAERVVESVIDAATDKKGADTLVPAVLPYETLHTQYLNVQYGWRSHELRGP